MIEKRVDGEHYTNCGYTTKRTGHMREHVEKHIEGLEYPIFLENTQEHTAPSVRSMFASENGNEVGTFWLHQSSNLLP